MVERSPGMRGFGGSIPSLVKQKKLKFEVRTKELDTDLSAQSQDNGLRWNITAYPWSGVSVG